MNAEDEEGDTESEDGEVDDDDDGSEVSDDDSEEDNPPLRPGSAEARKAAKAAAQHANDEVTAARCAAADAAWEAMDYEEMTTYLNEFYSSDMPIESNARLISG